MSNPRIECGVHGWQESMLYTVYDRKSRPRDRPDRYVCAECAKAGAVPDETNSVRIAPDA